MTIPDAPTIATLDDARAFIARVSRHLDPTSRYITELLAIVDASSDLDDLLTRLSEGCRGRYWAGPRTFDAMSTAQKLRVNLITNETSLMRFEAGEFDFLRTEVIPFLRRSPGRVLSMPCSHGEEPVSLAIEMVEAGVSDFGVQGYDILPACIETARSGRIPLSGLPRYVLGLVADEIMKHLEFEVADAMNDPLGGPYDFVVCRNFLGYFTPDIVAQLLETLRSCLASPGYLLLDSFIVGKHPQLFEDYPLRRCGDLPFFSS